MFVIGLIIFLVLYSMPFLPIQGLVNGGLLYLGGETWIALSNTGAAVAANPVYQQYHMLIWLAGGMVLMYALIRLQIRKRVAEWIHPPKMASTSTTVVEVRAATPPYATSRPTQLPVVNPSEAIPVEVKKETEATA